MRMAPPLRRCAAPGPLLRPLRGLALDRGAFKGAQKARLGYLPAPCDIWITKPPPHSGGGKIMFETLRVRFFL